MARPAYCKSELGLSLEAQGLHAHSVVTTCLRGLRHAQKPDRKIGAPWG